jgi:hypothetical protein
VAISDTLLTAYTNAVQQYDDAQAAYVANGDRPDFTIDGVAVQWPEYELFLLDKIDRAQQRYIRALEIETITNPFEVQTDLGS